MVEINELELNGWISSEYIKKLIIPYIFQHRENKVMLNAIWYILKVDCILIFLTVGGSSAAELL